MACNVSKEPPSMCQSDLLLAVGQLARGLSTIGKELTMPDIILGCMILAAWLVESHIQPPHPQVLGVNLVICLTPARRQ